MSFAPWTATSVRTKIVGASKNRHQLIHLTSTPSSLTSSSQLLLKTTTLRLSSDQEEKLRGSPFSRSKTWSSQPPPREIGHIRFMLQEISWRTQTGPLHLWVVARFQLWWQTPSCMTPTMMTFALKTSRLEAPSRRFCSLVKRTSNLRRLSLRQWNWGHELPS